MASAVTQPSQFGIPALIGLAAGVFVWWQFRTDGIWVGLPFGILGGVAAALLASLVLEVLFGSRAAVRARR